ncbi:MAG: hypothetical protein JNL28_11775 [Planctomycetes bacterium]|nr:hypothetical protein [Planctomycetota bacterium]
MKPILLILGLVLAAGAGAVGGMMAAPRATRTAIEPVVLQATPSASETSSTLSPELEKRLQHLSMEIGNLGTQLAALSEDRTRTPATTASASTTPQLGLAATSPEVFAAVNREGVLKILADERAEQERVREEERKVREQKMIEAQAERAAAKFNLSAAQQRSLSDFYAQERQRISDVRSQFRDGQQEPGADSVREAFREAKEWRNSELTRLFGTDLGAQISEFETDGFRRGNNGQQRRGGGADAPAAGAGPGAPAAGARAGRTRQ